MHIDFPLQHHLILALLLLCDLPLHYLVYSAVQYVGTYDGAVAVPLARVTHICGRSSYKPC